VGFWFGKGKVNFKDIGLHPLIQAGVDESNFIECTPIQSAAIPPIIEGRDVAGLAQTGTGKTAAFLLPLMDRIVRSKQEPTQISAATDLIPAATPSEATPAEAPVESEAQGSEAPARPIFKGWRKTNFVLVLVPTRELADQVCTNAVKLGKSAGLRAAAIYGGTGYEGQKAALRGGVDFVVATPGRLIDLYKENLVDLGQVRAIVFDEADRMFDMGFKDDMKYILRRVPNDRQFLVFSATLNFDVLNTAYEFGANPVDVNVSRDQTKAENVEDEIFHVGSDEKPKFLLSLLQKRAPKQAIVFSNFKHNVERIARFLSQNGIPAMGISSLISQSQRTRIMELFREDNDRNILVATDVAARGLDIKGVDLVINFELPDDAENYVHRIGRTGRAGEKGHALSLVGDKDVEALSRIENYLGHKITIGWIEDSDIVKEFKEFPRDRDFSDRGGRREGGGGFRGQDRGPRRDHRPDHRPDRGPRRDGPRDHSRGDRPHRGERGPEGRQQNAQSQNAHPNARPQRHGQNHRGPRSGEGRRHPNDQRTDRRPHQHQRGEGRPGRSSFTHRPNQGAPVAAKSGGPSVITKVRGFFKKLFS
jgi:ATP-dependent RNA helicase RhlB